MAVFKLTNGTTPAGADVMQLTGDRTVRINLTNPKAQIKGLDVNDNGVIQANGIENKASSFIASTGTSIPSATVAGLPKYEIFNAYATNPLDTSDSTNNFIGDIFFNGTGVDGDGVSTNGNIYLGGLGVDSVLGGIGNDFIAGGGVAASRFAWQPNAVGTLTFMDTLHNTQVTIDTATADYLSGGRNADFFFADLSVIDATDGNSTTFDGGNTTDDSAAGLAPVDSGVKSQNNDWILLEATDDDEPVGINLATGTISTNAGATATLVDIESIDASGNLYGMVNDVAVSLGERATDDRSVAPVAGTENYGIGSTAQLNVLGSAADNVIIGSYDNDKIDGSGGDDILFGGNLGYLLANKNNPNLLNAAGGLSLNVTKVGTVNDGVDNLTGGVGSDNIVFEMDGGKVDGGVSTNTTSADLLKDTGDTLWLTDFSMGRVKGATLAGEATAQAAALAKLTADAIVRFDLGNNGTATYKGYGHVGTTPASQDQTNYATGAKAVTTTGMDSVIATGLGDIDFKAAGNNSPELTFNNQQNFKGINANLDLRGSVNDNILYANTGNDVVEGRTGDDNLSGGTGNDKFYFAAGDGVDVVHRQKDTVSNSTGAAGTDQLWDTDANGNRLFTQDFRPFITTTTVAGTSSLAVDFQDTVLDQSAVKLNFFQITVDKGATAVVHQVGGLALQNATTMTDAMVIVNSQLHAQDPKLSAAYDAPTNTITITDAGGREMLESNFSVGTVVKDGGIVNPLVTYHPVGEPVVTTVVENDILIFKDYVSRFSGLGTDLNQAAALKDVNNTLSTADDNNNVKIQAADFVTNFTATAAGTQLAQAQNELIRVTNAHIGDVVSVTVNGVAFSYTVQGDITSNGVDAVADGSIDSWDAVKGLVNVINTYVDTNTAAGKLNATVAVLDNVNFPNLVAPAESSAQFSLTQVVVDNSQTYMNVDVTQPAGTGALVEMHDQSSNNIQLYGFDGRHGNLDQSNVLFVGKIDTLSSSTLKTAKDAGGDLNGTNASANGLNGDDLLIGGKGNDNVNGGSGDDRILMSQGNDTVNGGSNFFVNNILTKTYTDTLQAEESAFAPTNNAKFTVSLTQTPGSGTVTAVDSVTNAALGTTTFTGMEVVRVLESDHDTTLDVSQLPGAIVANIFAGTAVWYNVTGFDPLNGLPIGAQTTKTYGAESLSTSTGNDIVNLDQSQITANNVLDLGAQIDGIPPVLTEGMDIVSYTDGADDYNNVTGLPVAGNGQVTVTLNVGATTQDTVSMTGGMLGATQTTDSLTNVEQINFDALATEAYNDTLNLSAITGATVNYTGANILLGNAVLVPAPTTVAQVDQNSLEAGGVSVTSTTSALGVELINVGGAGGIKSFEKVTGSTGADRVIVGDNLQNRVMAVAGTFAPNPFEGYTWDLSTGADILDYRAETNNMSVMVDTTATSTDKVSIINPALVLTGGLERIDTAIGVETYFGSADALDVAVRNNGIDLTAATVDTTIEFSVGNINTTITDPNVVAGSAFYHTDVRETAVPTNVFASFVDADVNNKDWRTVTGGAKNETVKFNLSDLATAHTLNLGTGSNVVDYSIIPVAGTNAITLTGNHNSWAAVKAGIAANDTLTGNLTVIGSALADTVVVTGSAAAGVDHVVVDLSATAPVVTEYNILSAVVGTTNLSSFENITGVDEVIATVGGVPNVVTVTGKDTLTGSTGNNTILGLGGNDTINGMGGTDTLDGGNGNDSITGGAGNDNILGGLGNDVIATGDGSNTVDGGAGNDTVTGGATGDTIAGGAGDDQITGMGGNTDSLTGGLGNDQFIYTSYLDSTDTDSLINPTTNGLVVPFVQPANLVFDAETLGDFSSGVAGNDDQIVVYLQDSADMLHVRTYDPDGTGVLPATPVNYFSLGAVAGTPVTVNNVTTTVTGGVAANPVLNPITLTSTAGLFANTVVMSLGTDHTVGTTLNQAIVGAPLVADVNTIDQVLTLKTNVGLTAGDFLLRVGQSLLAQTEDFDITAGLPVSQVQAQVQYTAANQSQSGLVDTLKSFNFLTDLLDFSTFKFSTLLKDYDSLAITGHNAGATATGNGIQTDEMLRVDVKSALDPSNLLNNGFNADVAQNPDLFANNGKVLFVLEAQSDPLAAPGSYRLFVDADQNGQFDAAKDMVIDFANEANAVVGALPTIASVLTLIGTQVTTDPTVVAPIAIDSLFMI